ncbi:MAG: hypothetical protein NWR72_01735 [Bacteroidia bacterium]|nr:hypothetical protein [Bacteroidia bacterium]
MRPTKSSQEKLQAILKSQGYTIRYERGNFQGGYCIVHDQKTIVINKFHPIEGKINSMIDIIKALDIVEDQLTEDQKKVVDKLKTD